MYRFFESETCLNFRQAVILFVSTFILIVSTFLIVGFNFLSVFLLYIVQAVILFVRTSILFVSIFLIVKINFLSVLLLYIVYDIDQWIYNIIIELWNVSLELSRIYKKMRERRRIKATRDFMEKYGGASSFMEKCTTL